MTLTVDEMCELLRLLDVRGGTDEPPQCEPPQCDADADAEAGCDVPYGYSPPVERDGQKAMPPGAIPVKHGATAEYGPFLVECDRSDPNWRGHVFVPTASDARAPRPEDDEPESPAGRSPGYAAGRPDPEPAVEHPGLKIGVPFLRGMIMEALRLPALARIAAVRGPESVEAVVMRRIIGLMREAVDLTDPNRKV